ncbi:hypothetical protein [Hymenobacter koreensis]|uniref:Uncharacterized protein n=1 Tax=Hymenobacter koreensis TaxID=1084523 RepID=A0ABP8JP37_9BACT
MNNERFVIENTLRGDPLVVRLLGGVTETGYLYPDREWPAGCLCYTRPDGSVRVAHLSRVRRAETVPSASSLQQHVLSVASSLKGGARRPYRVFKSVGATAKAPDPVSSGQPEIRNVEGETLKYAIRSISVTVLTAPTLATTVSIGTNAAANNIFSRTVALANVPAVGNTIELLGLSGVTLPADVVLPATILAKCTSGTVEIVIDGLLK